MSEDKTYNKSNSGVEKSVSSVKEEDSQIEGSPGSINLVEDDEPSVQLVDRPKKDVSNMQFVPPTLAASNKTDVKGGRYFVRGKWVNAYGKPVK